LVLWLANLSGVPRAIRIVGMIPPGQWVSMVDAAAFTQVTQEPDALDAKRRSFAGEELTLDAYAVARIE
jgi:hypothetical protein